MPEFNHIIVKNDVGESDCTSMSTSGVNRGYMPFVLASCRMRGVVRNQKKNPKNKKSWGFFITLEILHINLSN